MRPCRSRSLLVRASYASPALDTINFRWSPNSYSRLHPKVPHAVALGWKGGLEWGSARAARTTKQCRDKPRGTATMRAFGVPRFHDYLAIVHAISVCFICVVQCCGAKSAGLVEGFLPSAKILNVTKHLPDTSTYVDLISLFKLNIGRIWLFPTLDKRSCRKAQLNFIPWEEDPVSRSRKAGCGF